MRLSPDDDFTLELELDELAPAADAPAVLARKLAARLGGSPAELPPLEIKDDTPNLLLTWIDDKGDFHVVQKPADVPVEGRKSVRVVVSTREEGTGALVYVTNLDETDANGAYRLKTMPRAEWEELGASKRKAPAGARSSASRSARSRWPTSRTRRGPRPGRVTPRVVPATAPTVTGTSSPLRLPPWAPRSPVSTAGAPIAADP